LIFACVKINDYQLGGGNKFKIKIPRIKLNAKTIANAERK
jgi:hypothetical protein